MKSSESNAHKMLFYKVIFKVSHKRWFVYNGIRYHYMREVLCLEKYVQD